jgi:putative ABC transport system ATP-binding protein
LIYRGMPVAERQKLAARALDRVGLSGRGHHTSAELSGGQQQRVAIARAIVTDPEVLLADEPTGNLDTKTSREIMELVTSLNVDQRMTVVMVTHETDIAAYARRMVRFLDGRIESDVINKEAA